MNSIVFRNRTGVLQRAVYEVTPRIIQPGVPPPTIFITPLVNTEGLNLNDDEWFHAAHRMLQYEVRRAIRNYNGWSDAVIDDHVVGVFQMRNNVDGQTLTAHEENMFLERLTVEEFVRIYDRVVNLYNKEIPISTIEWSYWIDPASLHIGGGGNTVRHVGLLKLSCNDYPNISCAAMAITLWLIMYSDEPEYSQLKHNINRATEQRRWQQKALEFQERMQWNKVTSKAQVLQAVNLLTKYRIVIVQYIIHSSKVDSKCGVDYFEEEPYDKIIYLFYDFKEEHFSAISAVQHFIQQIKRDSSIRWCHPCASFRCNDHKPIPKRNPKTCQHCQQETYSLPQHNCFYDICKTCYKEYKLGQEMDDHRCPINVRLTRRPTPFQTIMNSTDKKSKQLWAYDFESAIEKDPTDKSSLEFVTNEEGYYEYIETLEDDNVKRYIPHNTEVPAHKQLPNYVVYKNVFTGETRETESITEFVQDMLFKTNDGNNVVVAHNASGYDSRLIFDEMSRMVGMENRIELIPRGSKILRMSVGKTVFIDSMLHLSGSLKSLAGECLKGNPDYENMEKGYFPHLFNLPENRYYIGPTPDIKYYDLTSFAKDEKDLEAFHEYYDSIKDRQDWNLWEELTKYCRQDVDILATLMKLFHDTCLEAVKSYTPHLEISPWHYTTAPGYVHALFLFNLELDNGATPPTERAKESWAILKKEEYYFARKALRGGRTETRMHFYEGRILDIDINSQYPTVQMAKSLQLCGETIPILYPVGYPNIEMHDMQYYPCNLHFEEPQNRCQCSLEIKRQFRSRKLKIFDMTINPITNLHEYINNFFGILLVDATPPTNLYHPVLPVYDEEKKKCFYSCEPIVRKTFCSPELQLAIKKGYRVTKIYRADRYKSDTTTWGGEDGGLLGVFLKIKIMNSSDAPPIEEQEECAKYYKDNFEMELDFTPSKWGKRPAYKKCSKICCNCAWGKHAETVDHDLYTVVDEEGVTEGLGLMESFRVGKNRLNSFQPINDKTMLVKYKANRQNNLPNLTKAYLPCAVFVPMYGRLMLYNVLDKYQKNVIMMDTDSIKVAMSGTPDLNTLQVGNYLGQWEDESKGDPMVGFISLGPKTYGQKHEKGGTKFKCKGVTLKRGHEKLMNYERAKEIYFTGAQVSIPQIGFGYQFGKGISTRGFMKIIKFEEHLLKGKLNREDNCVYPFGYIDDSIAID